MFADPSETRLRP